MAELENVTTTFTIAAWDEKPYDEQDGLKLTKARFEKAYRGDIAGRSVTESLMVYRSDGTASFVSHERFEGSVRGKSGSFVIQATGRYTSGVVDSLGRIVEGSGTGELRGIAGEVPYKSGEAKEYPLTFRLRLA
jgi:hypothetical protein